MKSLSGVRLFAIPWTAAYQAPPSMGFSRQEYWSGVPLPSPLEGLEELFHVQCQEGWRLMVERLCDGAQESNARGSWFFKSGVLAEWGLLSVRTTYSNPNSR